jgi:hypothetical protein
LYALKTINGYPLFISLKTFNPTISFKKQQVTTSTSRYNSEVEKLFDIEFLKYNAGKDPPVLNHTPPLTV